MTETSFLPRRSQQGRPTLPPLAAEPALPQITLPSGTATPPASRATENALISSVRDSPSAITSEIAFPTAGECCIPCPENPFASTNRGNSGTGPRIALWSGDTSYSPESAFSSTPP